MIPSTHCTHCTISHTLHKMQNILLGIHCYTLCNQSKNYTHRNYQSIHHSHLIHYLHYLQIQCIRLNSYYNHYMYYRTSLHIVQSMLHDMKR
jgi:hypothetical protein